jgi:hypothetical protein
MPLKAALGQLERVTQGRHQQRWPAMLNQSATAKLVNAHLQSGHEKEQSYLKPIHFIGMGNNCQSSSMGSW